MPPALARWNTALLQKARHLKRSGALQGELGDPSASQQDLGDVDARHLPQLSPQRGPAQAQGAPAGEGRGLPADARLPLVRQPTGGQRDVAEADQQSVLQTIIIAANEEEDPFGGPEGVDLPKLGAGDTGRPAAAAGEPAAASPEKRPGAEGRGTFKKPGAGSILAPWRKWDATHSDVNLAVMSRAQELSNQIKVAGDDAVRCHAWLHRKLQPAPGQPAPPAAVLEEVWTSSRHITARLRRQRHAEIAKRLAASSSRPSTRDGPTLRASRPGTRERGATPDARDGPARRAAAGALPQIRHRTVTLALYAEQVAEADSSRPQVDGEPKRKERRADARKRGTGKRIWNAAGHRQGEAAAEPSEEPRAAAPPDDPFYLPELPRLRSRFRDQSRILQGLWKQEAATRRRAYRRAAEELGLEGSDLDPSRSYDADLSHLRAAASRKLERRRREAAARLQRAWRVRSGRRKLLRCVLTLLHAVLRLQRWWRLLPTRARGGRVAAAAVRLQAFFRGHAARRGLGRWRAIRGAVQELDGLRDRFGGPREPPEGLVRLQAAVRGFLARRRLLGLQASVRARTPRRPSSSAQRRRCRAPRACSAPGPAAGAPAPAPPHTPRQRARRSRLAPPGADLPTIWSARSILITPPSVARGPAPLRPPHRA